MARRALIALLTGFSLWPAAAASAQTSPARPAPRATALDEDQTPPRQIVCPSEEVRRKWLRPIDKIEADIGLSPGATPMDCSGPVFDGGSDSAPGVTQGAGVEFQWCPTDLYYWPLYFDDTPLERYGQTPCALLQPAISAAHFFAVLPTLPYRVAVDRTRDHIYTLGYYRPGSPTPCLRQRLPRP